MKKLLVFLLISFGANNFAFEGELKIKFFGGSNWAKIRATTNNFLCWHPYRDGNGLTTQYNTVDALPQSGYTNIYIDTEGDGFNTLGRSIYEIHAMHNNWLSNSYFYLNTIGTEYYDLLISYDRGNDQFYLGEYPNLIRAIGAGEIITNVLSNNISGLEDGWEYNNCLTIVGNPYTFNPRIFWGPRNDLNIVNYKICRAITSYYPANANDFQDVTTVSSSTIYYTDQSLLFDDINGSYVTYKVKAGVYSKNGTVYVSVTNDVLTFGELYKKNATTSSTNTFIIHNNYPNPFNPTTTIKYNLPKDSKVQIKVFDILGKEVAELMNEEKPAGIHEVEFNASSLSSGIYFYRIHAGSFIATKKMILMK